MVKGEGWEDRAFAEKLVAEAQVRFEKSHYESAAEAEADEN